MPYPDIKIPVACEVVFYTKTKSWSKERKEEYKLREWMQLNEKGTEA